VLLRENHSLSYQHTVSRRVTPSPGAVMRGNGASRNAAPAHDASEKGLTHLQGGSPGDTECRGLLHRQVVGHNEEQVRVRLGVLCESSSVGVERTVGDTGDLVADLSLRLLVRANLDDLA